MIGVKKNADGTYTATTYYQSRTFTTLKAATMWLNRIMNGNVEIRPA